MAQQTVKQTKMTHKDGQPRRTLHRTRLKQNDDIRDEYKIEPKQISRVIGEWEMIIFSHI